MAARPQYHDTTVDDAEVARFAALADTWWDPRGKMAVLHKFNPVRLTYIRDAACTRRFKRDPKKLDCLGWAAHSRHRLRRRVAVRAAGAARRKRGRRRPGVPDNIARRGCTPSAARLAR